MTEDIVWFTDELDKTEDIKESIWTDEDFKDFVIETGLVDSLRQVSDFHKSIADQLKAQGVTSPDESDWARRTIGLCVRLKSRRQQLRRAVRASRPDGDEIVRQIAQEMREEWDE